MLANNITTIDQLTTLSEVELRDIKGLGQGCINNIKQVLADNGLVLNYCKLSDNAVFRPYAFLENQPDKPRRLTKSELSEIVRVRNKLIYEAISQGASRSSQCQKFSLSLGGLQSALAAHKRTLGITASSLDYV